MCECVWGHSPGRLVSFPVCGGLLAYVRACARFHWISLLLLKCVRAAGGYACVWLIVAYHGSELDSPWLSEALLLVQLLPWRADDTKFVQQIAPVCDALTVLQNGEF